jgi:hypothetical protein
MVRSREAKKQFPKVFNITLRILCQFVFVPSLAKGLTLLLDPSQSSFQFHSVFPGRPIVKASLVTSLEYILPTIVSMCTVINDTIHPRPSYEMQVAALYPPD